MDDKPMAETELPSTSNSPSGAPPERRRGALTRFLAVALLAMVGVALYLAWPDIKGLRDSPAPSVEQAAAPEVPLEAAPIETPAPVATAEAPAPNQVELDALRARLEALEQAGARPVSAAPADVAIAQQLTEFAARLDAIDRRPPSEGDAASMARDVELGAHLANLEKRLAAAETAAAEVAQFGAVLQDTYTKTIEMMQRLMAVELRTADDVRLMALATAKAALWAASREGAALAHEIADLQALLPDAAPIAAPLGVINQFADHGALNYEALRARFPTLAREVVHASAKPDADAGWVDQTIARLSSIVTIRKTSGELAPGSLDERLVRAECALAESNGKAALEALDSLKGGETLNAFSEELKRRTALDEAVRALDRYVTGLIAARVVPAPANTTQ